MLIVKRGRRSRNFVKILLSLVFLKRASKVEHLVSRKQKQEKKTILHCELWKRTLSSIRRGEWWKSDFEATTTLRNILWSPVNFVMLRFKVIGLSKAAEMRGKLSETANKSRFGTWAHSETKVHKSTFRFCNQTSPMKNKTGCFTSLLVFFLDYNRFWLCSGQIC